MSRRAVIGRAARQRAINHASWAPDAYYLNPLRTYSYKEFDTTELFKESIGWWLTMVRPLFIDNKNCEKYH